MGTLEVIEDTQQFTIIIHDWMMYFRKQVEITHII